MKRWALFTVILVLSLLAFSQGPSSSSQSDRQAAQEEQFQIRRQNFASGRQLLLEKGVPFDPDELLRDEWSSDLKAKLNSLPEMRETRYEKAPLKGAYLADTLYFPEKVQLTGHTLILANYVVFEGKNPTIKGNFDLHFFPTRPVTVLGDTLANLLQKRPELLNVRMRRTPALPSVVLIKDLIQAQPHVITFDTSGPEPEWRTHPLRKPKPDIRPVAWKGLPSAVLQSGNQDTSGAPGATGAQGSFGNNGTAGASSGKAPNGSCGGSFNGMGGTPGGKGTDGGNAGTGTAGGPGGNARAQNINVVDGDINAYNYIANGGDGGQGGVGGDGGRGGDGGKGGDGGDGVACGCQVGDGGDASFGGNGGNGGTGGIGGNGGNGGAGGTITVSLPWNSNGPGKVSVTGGTGGPASAGGQGGAGGNAGPAGTPGQGAGACGVTGNNGSTNFPGTPGTPGNSGNGGTQSSSNGPNGSYTISRRPQPPSGGGGGSVPDPCVGTGATAPPSGTIASGPVGNVTNNLPQKPECSPIIIDTEGEGFHLTSALSGVSFDITGTGQPVQMGWTDSHFHNAFLALPGSDGLVHSGKELFGDFTPQPPSDHPNGFLALAEYDKPENGGNGDGIIDEHDAVFSKLRLWIDENHDGVCQPNELHRLPEFGIYSLALKYEESRRTDQFGNQFRYRGRVNPGARKDPRDNTPTGESSRWEYDVFFVTK